jgi:hypothetical protein
MDNPVHRVVAEKRSWRTIAPWIPALLVPIALALLLAGYVVFQAAS